MVRFRLLCGDFLLPNPAPHLENRKTVCMGYPAMTSQERAGKRRRKGAGNPCRENGTLNINWSKWSVDSTRNGISGSKWATEKAGRAEGRDSQIFACQLARCKSAESAALCPSDMMLCVISYWVLSGAKRRQIQQLRCCALSRQAVEMKEAPAKPYTKIRKK